MQIAKSLNYKMRCKGSLKTPPTRIKCIIFFHSCRASGVCFLHSGKKLRKNSDDSGPPNSCQNSIWIAVHRSEKKVWHIFKCFLSTVKLGGAFFLLHACTDWGVVDRVWNSKACFFYHLRRFAPQQRNSRIFCNTQNNLLSLFWVVVALHICRSSHCSNWLLARRTKGVSFSEENDGRPADTAHSRRASTETKRSTKSNCSNKNFI